MWSPRRAQAERQSSQGWQRGASPSLSILHRTFARPRPAAAFPKERVNDLNWALRRSDPELNWGIGSDPEDEGNGVVLAAAHVDLVTVLDDAIGSGAWTLRRQNSKADTG